MPQQKPTLLQLRPLTVLEDGQARLNRAFNVIELWKEANPDAAILAHQNDIVAMMTSGMNGADAALIDKLPKLKAICHWGVGYDSIDVKHAQQKNIQISNTPGVLNDCVADLAWGLILATARRMGQNERYARASQWGKEPARPLGARVSGKKLGIVGLGRVGLAIADRSVGFNMKVRYHNRHARPDTNWTYESSLVDLAKWADFLVIVTVGGPSTLHLIDRSVIQALGPDGLLINIARGSVVDQDALVKALTKGELGGAGLDVYEDEPNIPDELKSMDNVVLLPHIGSATTETRRAMSNLVVENAEAFAATGKVITQIDKAA
ncbi:MAG: 2-hydroxyacid dehydrogenase [Burkholderiaceae bacterium]